MRLINETTKEEVKIGDELTDFRGDKAILKDMRAPREYGKSGYVYTREEGDDYDRQLYPHVYGLKFVE